MAFKNALPAVLAFACVACMFSGLLADPYYGPFSNTDITGRDVDCGQPGVKYCKFCKGVCNDPFCVISKCSNDELCFAITWDGKCGYLKNSRVAGDGAYRSGWTTFWLNKSPNWRQSVGTDISNRDINCGQGTSFCKYCTNPSDLIKKCRTNRLCYSVTYDGSCGYLKTSKSARDGTRRSGWTTYWLSK